MTNFGYLTSSVGKPIAAMSNKAAWVHGYCHNSSSRPARPETAGGTSSSAPLPFGGTAVLIMIGVGLDTVKQIESQLMQRNYEGFLE
jgi:hypothetical protein